MSGGKDPVAAAYIEACLAELDAPKPGNVHRFAPGHGMEVEDFIRSAEASAAPIAARGVRVGIRVRAAVDATFSAVGQNTNLGIILLCAPLAAAAEAEDAPLRPALARVLDRLDLSDAADVFSAIAAANPGGLGRAPRHDVNAPVVATLREAMAEAAERDRIARQYVTTYDDVFSLGLPVLATARPRYSGPATGPPSRICSRTTLRSRTASSPTSSSSTARACAISQARAAAWRSCRQPSASRCWRGSTCCGSRSRS